ncbi:MAG TPA: hypothetical protein VHW44_03845 [Pseudonocardiaceae bacterium]|nr:hypothetical protein [Pseudonocardiaceae bacterium]
MPVSLPSRPMAVVIAVLATALVYFLGTGLPPADGSAPVTYGKHYLVAAAALALGLGRGRRAPA